MEKVHSVKFIIKFTFIAMIILVIICVFLSMNEMDIKRKDVSGTQVISTEAIVTIENSYFEIVDDNEALITVSGWCVIVGKDTKPVAMHILLRDINKDEYFEMPTHIVTRTDITQYFGTDTNYDNSGFSVCVNSDNLDFMTTNYEICVLYETGESSYLIHSGEIIINNEGTN